MNKVTIEDYKAYGGIEVDEVKLANLLLRATRDVEALTSFRIRWDALTGFRLQAVKNAVCAQVEFLALKGETASTVTEAEGGSFTIGSYSESVGQRGRTNASQIITRAYADSVKAYLWPTGLLFAGVIVDG